MNINSVVITGNLVNAPELRYTNSGTAVVSGTIANNEFYLDESGAKQQITTFVDFNVWAKRGEALAQMAKKGQHVYLEGQLRQEIWEDKKDGSTRSKHVLRVRDWQFTQFRASEAAPAAASSSGSGTKPKRARKASSTPPPVPSAIPPEGSEEAPF
jgi:single-strand DNA-binding protein